MSNIAGAATFKITNTKLYVPIVSLKRKENVSFTKQLSEGFKRSVYWNEYKTKTKSKDLNNDNPTRFHLDVSFQGVKRLLVVAFDNSTTVGDDNNNDDGRNKVKNDNHRKYFLPRANITNYIVLIDSRNFYNQPVNDQIKKYDEIRKIGTGQGDDCTTVCLLGYQYFRDHYQ